MPALHALTLHGDAHDRVTEAGIRHDQLLLSSRTLSSFRSRCAVPALTASTLRALADTVSRTLTELCIDDPRVHECGVLACLLGPSGSSRLRRLRLPPLPPAGIS
jgi:hypothetical protein